MLVFFAGLAITVTVLAFNLLGDGISRTLRATERITPPPKEMRVIAMATIMAGMPVPMAIEMAIARIRSGNAWSTSIFAARRPARERVNRPLERSRARGWSGRTQPTALIEEMFGSTLGSTAR